MAVDHAYLAAQLAQMKARHAPALVNLGRIEGAIEVLNQLSIKAGIDEAGDAMERDLTDPSPPSEADAAGDEEEAIMRQVEPFEDEDKPSEPSENPDRPAMPYEEPERDGVDDPAPIYAGPRVRMADATFEGIERAGPPTVRAQDRATPVEGDDDEAIDADPPVMAA